MAGDERAVRVTGRFEPRAGIAALLSNWGSEGRGARSGVLGAV